MLNKDEMICNAINGAVEATGYPVTNAVLSAIGVDRKEIRRLERKGFVKSVDLALKNGKVSRSGNVQVVKGYYTDKVYPRVLVAHEKHTKETNNVKEG